MLKISKIAKLCQDYMAGRITYTQAMWAIYDTCVLFIKEQMKGP